MRDETIDFTAARTAIEDLLGRLPEGLGQVTDLHIYGGQASARVRGGMQAVEIGGDLDYAVANLANLTATALRREINHRSPILSQRIPPGCRVTVWHPAITQDGRWTLKLRLLAIETIPLEQWVADGFLSGEDHGRLVRIMGEPKTVLFAGTLGAGKTQLMRACLDTIPQDQHVIVLEDADELNVQRPNTSALHTSHAVDLTALIASSFRGDAQRIVVGEILDHAAMQFLTLASGGVRALTTLHTEGDLGALVRLHQLVLQGGYAVTMEQVRQAIHAVVTVRRLPDGGRSVEVLEL